MIKTDTFRSGCFWITGLSGSGKTTIAELLRNKLVIDGYSVILLDGDILRKVFNSKAYSYEERKTLGFQYSRLCKLLVSQGISVVIGVIGLFHELHAWNRENIPNYVEIFLDTPLDELKRRDIKGIYRNLEEGKIKNVTGIDIAAEFPLTPNIKIKWNEAKDAKATFDEVILKLKI